MSATSEGVAVLEPQRAVRPTARRRLSRAAVSLLSTGEPKLWLTGGGLVLCLIMVVGLLALVFAQGIATFWPSELVWIQTTDGRNWLGEVTRDDRYRPEDGAFGGLSEEAAPRARELVGKNDGWAHRRLLRIGNYELTGEHFVWLSDFEVAAEHRPPWALVVERLTWGRFYGEPKNLLIDGVSVASEPEALWREFQEHHGPARARWKARRELERKDTGEVNRRLEDARLALRSVELEKGKHSSEWATQHERFLRVEERAKGEFDRIRERIDALDRENARYQLELATADGQTKLLALSDVVRAYPANQLGWFGKLKVYLGRWWEYLRDDPREANSEGGVFPAIFGTVVMTLLMSLVVVPFGVLAALYLREYAKAGALVSSVRIAINNLAGVPSIVFGVFGLGFFCYIVGGGIDEVLFAEKLPNPTFGTGGIMWASLTLALLTLPVVIVSTEEALAAVPRSMREGSYACGASQWQTIRRIVLPRAMPGIMTGMILAMARGAGEVAPLMLVGAVKLAPELPLDGIFPFVHPERSFMHLGFHIYDLGFQSQNSEAAKPMVFTTTLLLIFIVVALNCLAIWIRARLQRRFTSTHI